MQVLENTLIECGRANVPAAPLYFIQTGDAAAAQVRRLRVNGNTVQTTGSFVTDIGRIAFGYDTSSSYYTDVNRDENTPSYFVTGAENLINKP